MAHLEAWTLHHPFTFLLLSFSIQSPPLGQFSTSVTLEYSYHQQSISRLEKVKSQSRSVVSDSLRPHGLHSTWDSPGQNTAVGSLSPLQGIFRTQGSNPGPPHCGRILYQLSHQDSPKGLFHGFTDGKLGFTLGKQLPKVTQETRGGTRRWRGLTPGLPSESVGLQSDGTWQRMDGPSCRKGQGPPDTGPRGASATGPPGTSRFCGKTTSTISVLKTTSTVTLPA